MLFITQIYQYQDKCKNEQPYKQLIYELLIVLTIVQTANEYMKRAASPLLNDSKTLDCITRFQLIPPNLVTKDNPIFSAFSKNRFRRPLLNDVQEVRNNRSENFIHEIKLNEDNSINRSLLLGRGNDQVNMLEGLLKARRSHIKKIKLKEFYLEEYDEQRDLQEQKDNSKSEVKITPIQSKNSTEFNTIDSKPSKACQKVFFLPSRKKLLPAKLRAKSYSNFPKNPKQRSIDSIHDQNTLYIKAKKNQCLQKVLNQGDISMKVTIQQEQQPPSQQAAKEINKRRSLRSVKVKKACNFEQHNTKALQDISSKIMNQQSIQILSQKDINNGFRRFKKHRKGLQSEHFSKQLDSNIDINPWANNYHEDDKDNQIFIFM